MADQNFDIAIRIITQQLGPEKAADVIKKIQEASTAAGKEGVKQEEAVTEATEKTFASKKQLKDMVKQLGHEFPLLGAAGRLAMNPIVAATAAVTFAIARLAERTREAVKDLGGFEMPDFTEEAVTRYERVSRASAEIKTNVSAIADVFTTFEKNQKIIDAFAVGFGNPPDRSEMMASAAREAGDRETSEADRLRAIAGNFDPKNSAIAEEADKKQIVALAAELARLDRRLKIAQGAIPGSPNYGGMGALKFNWEFGITDPAAKAAELQQSRDSVAQDLQLIEARGKRRGERGGAFAAAEDASGRAAGFYGQAAGFGTAAATAQGKNLKDAQDALATGDFTSLVQNIIGMTKAINEGNRLTAQGLADQEKSNQELKRQVSTMNQKP